MYWAGVEDAIALEGLAEKWEVDGPALVAKFRKLTPFEAWAAVLATKKWCGMESRETYEDRDGTLKAVGLVK